MFFFSGRRGRKRTVRDGPLAMQQQVRPSTLPVLNYYRDYKAVTNIVITRQSPVLCFSS